MISLGNIEELKEEVEKVTNDSKDNVTIAYQRDLKENLKSNKSMINKNLDEFNEILFDSWIGYIYLFDEKNNKWLWDCYSKDSSELDLKSLDEYLKIEEEKPLAPIIGADSNVYNLIGICSQALKNAGYPDKAKDMTNRIISSGSYEEALSIMCEYIEPVDQNYQELKDMDDYNYIDI